MRWQEEKVTPVEVAGVLVAEQEEGTVLAGVLVIGTHHANQKEVRNEFISKEIST